MAERMSDADVVREALRASGLVPGEFACTSLTLTRHNSRGA
jgi:hypothetical protein